MVTIKIETDNAAFAEDMCSEVARILRELSESFDAGMIPYGVFDINGNKVGTVKTS